MISNLDRSFWCGYVQKMKTHETMLGPVHQFRTSLQFYTRFSNIFIDTRPIKVHFIEKSVRSAKVETQLAKT